ncbi:MAG: DUF4179 domain-containing protein [Peptostreptococcaceae bacterium]
MKDKFELFNNIKINIEEYEEVHFSNNDEFKRKMKNKIRGDKNMHKRKIAVASVGILLGTMVIASEPSLAYIKNIGQQIEHFFNIEDNTLNGYKIELNQRVEDNGITIELKEIMLGDGELLLSLIIDDSKLDKSYFGVEKEKAKEIWPYLQEPKVTIGDMIFTRTGGASTSEPGDEISRNMLLTCDLSGLDTNNDGETDVENFDLITNLDMNKDYDLKIEIDKVGYTIESNSMDKASTQEMNSDNDIPNYIEISEINGGGINLDIEEEFKTKTGNVLGNWNFETSVNAKKLLEDIKIYDMKKEFTINYEDLEIDILIEEVRVSPTKIKIKRSFKVNGEVPKEDEAPKFVDFIVKDEKGNEIEVRGGIDLSATEKLIESSPYAEGELNREMKSIKIIPVIEDWGKKINRTKIFKEEAFTLELE